MTLLAQLLIAVAEHTLVGFAVLLTLMGVVVLVVAAWWGWRLWHAVSDLHSRVDSLEATVYAGEG